MGVSFKRDIAHNGGKPSRLCKHRAVSPLFWPTPQCGPHARIQPPPQAEANKMLRAEMFMGKTTACVDKLPSQALDLLLLDGLIASRVYRAKLGTGKVGRKSGRDHRLNPAQPLQTSTPNSNAVQH
jgi:hypothetical protein